MIDFDQLQENLKEELNNFKSLKNKFVDLKEDISSLEAELDEKKLLSKQLEEELIFTLEEAGISNLDLDGEKIKIKESVYARINKDKLPEALSFLREYKMDAIVKERLVLEAFDDEQKQELFNLINMDPIFKRFKEDSSVDITLDYNIHGQTLRALVSEIIKTRKERELEYVSLKDKPSYEQWLKNKDEEYLLEFDDNLFGVYNKKELKIK
jgi:hypothetical protein